MSQKLDRQLVDATRDLGGFIDPGRARATAELYASRHELTTPLSVDITRDLVYGDDVRHRLDVFRSQRAPTETLAPVIVFVHGGNFIAGDKQTPGNPFYDNVGLWSARAGFVGVTINYRLAPAAMWPAGAQDVHASVVWLRDNIGEFGGDPDTIIVVGASAGATHVASFLAGQAEAGEAAVAGAVLLSGIYDLAEFGDPVVLTPYYGTDTELWHTASPFAGLLDSDVPLMVVVAAHDPAVQQRQAAALVASLTIRHDRFPYVAFLPFHNHFSEVLHLGTEDTLFGDQVSQFVDACRLHHVDQTQIPTGG